MSKTFLLSKNELIPWQIRFQYNGTKKNIAKDS
jgi:hypothetical protein